MDELTLVVATPFKKKATSSLSIKDFEFALSFDLKWMAPDLASRIRDKAIRSRLLRLEGNRLIPAFAIEKIELPQGFKPSGNIFSEKTPIEELITMIAAKTGKTEKEAIAEINTHQERLGDLVDIEITALVVAKEKGCDIESIYQKLYDKVFNRE
ncbi:DUF2240 family protein [Methanolobus halotolerans]|uniref:DUF2240 domain-containing protein n=1 Tax=Methanolobus halotolerans TaxID=2052935 RepID=A0A4E0QTV8_9EURY|nr:DUF2240 family protein [Methanolobus halotolerans]TGC11455.1 DUF2240 domain-containing protein [Methanolobus halotolerans]